MVFFFATLMMVAFIRELMQKAHGIVTPTSTVTIFIAALILGKAVVIADLLPFINRFPRKPLAFNITWKTSIYFILALFIHYLERVIEQWRTTHDFIAANRALQASIVWPEWWALNIILFMLIVAYVVAHEFSRLLGTKTMWELFFGTPPMLEVVEPAAAARGSA